MKLTKAWAVLGLVAALAGGSAVADPPEPVDTSAAALAPSRIPESAVRTAMRRLPLTFEVNRGQAPQGWDFLVRCRSYQAFVRSDEVMFSFDGAGLAMSLDGAGRVGADSSGLELPGCVNYFRGNEPSKWLSNVATTRGVTYENVMAGTTFSLGGRDGLLEFAFDLAPGVDETRLVFDGASAMRVADDGSLRLAMPAGEVRIGRPVAWQDTATGRAHADVRFVVAGGGAVRISVDPPDRARATHVDPTVSYASFLGGSGTEAAGGAGIDPSGATYYAGQTGSVNFPTTGGAYDATLGTTGVPGNTDLVVAKINPAGSALVYSTYIGGAANETIRALAVNSIGIACVLGETRGNDYPTTPGVVIPVAPSSYASGAGVMTALNNTGALLAFSTYTLSAPVAGLALGTSGSIFVAEGAGISRYGANASSLGFHVDIRPVSVTTVIVRGIAADVAGNGYLVGETTDAVYPSPTSGALQTARLGAADAFVMKYTAAGALVYSTYLGGSGADYGKAIDVDGHGHAFVVGEAGALFPTTPAAYRTVAAGSDGFLARLSADGSKLVYSTGLGGTVGCDAVRAHSCGACVVGGKVTSTAFATLLAFQPVLGGGTDGFLMKFAEDGTIAWSSFCGGTGTDSVSAIGMSADGTVAVTGSTGSSDFPLVAPLQPTRLGTDLFVLTVPDTLNPAPTIGTAQLPLWTIGRPFSQPVVPVGGNPPFIFTGPGSPPAPGMSLGVDGVVSGTPTQVGTFQSPVHVVDACDLAVDGIIQLRFVAAPRIVSIASRSWTVGVPFEAPVSVVNGSVPIVLSVAEGEGLPPDGIEVTPDGRFTGTPMTVGKSTFTVVATDSAGATAEQVVMFDVNAEPSIGPTPVPLCAEAAPYSFAFELNGGTPPFVWEIAAGTPPNTGGINPVNGVLLGLAGNVGDYDFAVRVTDAAGVTVQRAFHAVVASKIIVVTASLPPAAAGRPYAAHFSATGGAPPLSWSVANEGLPAGLELDPPSGTIHGTVAEPGRSSFEVTCSDSCGSVVTRTYSIPVAGLVDVSSRHSSETIAFGGDEPTSATRALELTADTLLSVTLKGGAVDATLPNIVVTDPRGAPFDLTAQLKRSSKSATLRNWPVPASGRYFVSGVTAAKFEGKAKLSIAIAPKAVWPGSAQVVPGLATFAFSAPPGALVTITAKSATGDATPTIVSVTGPGGADLFGTGTVKEKASGATWKSATPLAGGDYLVSFGSRDGSAGTVAWTVKLKLPKAYTFALPDLAAGE